MGRNAGNLMVSGDANTGIGVNALANNTSGRFNTATGVDALGGGTMGSFNTATGVSALRDNIDGSYNTATGWAALITNDHGYSNTANGVGALENNTTGFENTATGFWALHGNTTGTNNTGIGQLALQFNTAGAENTAIGINALQNNSVGRDNTATGGYALQTGGGDGSTATGYKALQNSIAGENTATGAFALGNNTTGQDQHCQRVLCAPHQHDRPEQHRYRRTCRWHPAGLSNATAIGYNAQVNASNKIRLGDTQETVVEGPPYSTVSDKNAKENFKPVDADEVLRKIRDMSVTSWNYIGQDPKQFRHYGPVAQDFFAALGDDGVGNIGSPTTITSTDMNGVLVLAVQALGRENDAFKAENAELKTRIEALEELVKRTPQ